MKTKHAFTVQFITRTDSQSQPVTRLNLMIRLETQMAYAATDEGIAVSRSGMAKVLRIWRAMGAPGFHLGYSPLIAALLFLRRKGITEILQPALTQGR